MKNWSLKIEVFFISVLFFVSCGNTSLNREYYDSGIIKVEEHLNTEKEVVFRREFNENGKIHLEIRFSNGLLDGIVTSYYPDGRVEFEKKFDMGMEISYTSFDSLGNKDYWLKSLTQSDIPTFKKEFIQIVGSNDSGLVVNLSVPGISPFQILPVTKNANWKSIDIKKGDWLIMSKGDSIELGIGIKMTESTFFFMDYFKPVIISEIP